MTYLRLSRNESNSGDVNGSIVEEIKAKLATIHNLVDPEMAEVHFTKPAEKGRWVTILNHRFQLTNYKRNYQLGKPLAESEIQQVETCYQIHLPDN